MRIVVNKQWWVYLDLGRAGGLSLQLYWTYHRLLHMRVAVNSHALPIYKKNRIASLLCIFETTIHLSNFVNRWRWWVFFSLTQARVQFTPAAHTIRCIRVKRLLLSTRVTGTVSGIVTGTVTCRICLGSTCRSPSSRNHNNTRLIWITNRFTLCPYFTHKAYINQHYQ